MTVVIKYGGSTMTDERLRRRMAAAIRSRATAGARPVVVHGGGPFIARELARHGVTSNFVRGLRVTGDDAIGPVEQALTLLGKRLAQELGEGIALTGRDARLLTASRFDEELGHVGRMSDVAVEPLQLLLDGGFIPVVACLACDDEGRPLNVNGDEVAGHVAGALRAPAVFLSDVPGVLADPRDPRSLMATLTSAQAEQAIADGVVSGGMIPKVESALAAVHTGATWAAIASGLEPEELAVTLRGERGTRVVP